MAHVMLFIDADNVSLGVVEHAVAELRQRYGAMHLCHAWGSAEHVMSHPADYKRLRIRPMVNLSTGKNSTDIALALDALACVTAMRPAVVAIASSDSDFAPLVLCLREHGCRVLGFGQQGKVGAGIEQVYDEFVVVPVAAPAAPAPAKASVRKVAAKKAPAKKAPAKKSEAPPPKAAPKPEPADADRAALLAALPELDRGEAMDLHVVGPRLRARQLLPKSVSAAKKLGRHPEVFELLPAGKPTQVRLRAKA